MGFRIKRTKRDVEEIPLSSTADIAFLLIVFFLAASALLEFRGVVLPLPKKDAPPMQVLKKNLYRLKVLRSGAYEHDGKAISVRQIQVSMNEAYQGNRDLIISVRVHPEAPVDRIPRLVLLVQQLQIPRLSITAE